MSIMWHPGSAARGARPTALALSADRAVDVDPPRRAQLWLTALAINSGLWLAIVVWAVGSLD